MKRSTSSTSYYGSQGKKSQLLLLSIMDLPREISVNILLKLSVKCIFSCKFVCKTWYHLISSPEFVNQHLAQVSTSLLIRDVHYYLAEPLDHGLHDFGLKYCWCEPKCNSTYCRDITITPSAKLKVPTCHSQTRLVLNNQLDDCSNTSFHNKYRFLVNSCNGLVCLVESFEDGQGAIYNPSTGECLILPETFNNDHRASEHHVMHFRVCGLGFNPKCNEYKVIRIFQGKDGNVGAEIHTLGTNSCKSVGDVPHSALKLLFPTYHEGALHWIFKISMIEKYIISFDLDNDKFECHSFPPQCHQMAMSIGVLEGCLCMCGHMGNVFVKYIYVWVMKEIGAWESWTELFSFKIDGRFQLQGRGHYLPIYSSNGALVLYRHPHKALLYYDHGRKVTKMFRRLRDRYEFQLISYSPTFISLKNIVTKTRENVNSM